jgi:hypothetical protein
MSAYPIPPIPVESLVAYRLRLIDAIASTTSRVQFEDRTIERRTVDELLAALAWVDTALGGMTGIERSFPRVRVTVTHKDL